MTLLDHQELAQLLQLTETILPLQTAQSLLMIHVLYVWTTEQQLLMHIKIQVMLPIG